MIGKTRKTRATTFHCSDDRNSGAALREVSQQFNEWCQENPAFDILHIDTHAVYSAVCDQFQATIIVLYATPGGAQ